MSKPIVMERGVKYRDADKMALIPVKNVATEREALLRKPEWMKIKLPSSSLKIETIKNGMRRHQSRNAQKWPAFCLRGSLLP